MPPVILGLHKDAVMTAATDAAFERPHHHYSVMLWNRFFTLLRMRARP